MIRMFRAPGDPMPAKPPKFPHKPPANYPSYTRKAAHGLVRAAIAKAEAREKPED
jgi:hypothetical protein